MPELPEVEIVRRGLEPELVGRHFVRVETRRPDLRFPLPRRFARRLEGETVVALGRRAKYLLAHLSRGNVLVMHLGMTGRFSVSKPGLERALEFGELEYETGADPKHDHVVFHMSSGSRIIYNDPRRFGFMLLVSERELDAHPLFEGLGVEPLGEDLTADYLARRAAVRRSDIKAFLMDQRVVAGLGNIYVCETLFRAGLAPSRRASTLAKKSGTPAPSAGKLVAAIRAVLGEAIAAGGSTLRDYRQADGSKGGFQHAFSVYGRDGAPCARPGCRGIVRRSTDGGRSTFYCPLCQR